MRRSFLYGPALVALLAAPALAQGDSATLVRVRVVDTLGTPISGAEITATRGLNANLAIVITDSSGAREVSLPRDEKDYQISVRRIGYYRVAQFFRTDRANIELTIRMRETPALMEAVVVTAGEDLKRKRFYIDADDIAASERPIFNALDVVTKLRPDMMRPPGQGIYTRCGLSYVWINGKRIVFPPINPTLATTTRINRRAARAAPGIGVRGQSSINLSVQSVLHSIKPEHIEEMKYLDCDDASMKLARANGALFVVLKEGIAYKPGRGTYVAMSPADTVSVGR